jgi:photosystem II stability/assembly factor-like uncharacterized protein
MNKNNPGFFHQPNKLYSLIIMTILLCGLSVGIAGAQWVTFDEETGSAGNATQTIFVGVADNDGTCIYRTTNGGSTWQLVPGQPTDLPCPHKGKLDSVNDYLYIAYSDNGGPYDG